MNLQLGERADQSPFQQNVIARLGIRRFPRTGWILAVLAGLVLSFGIGPRNREKVSASSSPAGSSRGANSHAKSETPSSSSVAARDQMVRSYGNLPLSFEVNRGQTDPQVKVLSRGVGYTLFLTENEAVLTMPELKAKNNNPGAPLYGPGYATVDSNGSALRM